jgi:hypothetical protein
MKILYTLCLSFLLFSCSTQNSQIEHLDQRVTAIEQKVNASTLDSNVNVTTTGKPGNQNSYSSGSFYAGGSCHALTKKGTQCKRKPKGNGYCWQHGGL